LFYLLMASLQERQALIQRSKARGVETAFHYLPLHLSHMGQQFGGKPGDCPVTELVSDRLVRLPLYNGLSRADQALVVAALAENESISVTSEV
jgi:dTDP-4-amino-4,6-dideoxygalactose transaminase